MTAALVGSQLKPQRKEGCHRLYNTVIHYGLKDLCQTDTFHSFMAKLEQQIKYKQLKHAGVLDL